MIVTNRSEARFVRRENVKHFRLLLERTTDEAQCKKLHKLLAEERQKQVEAGDPADNESQAA